MTERQLNINKDTSENYLGTIETVVTGRQYHKAFLHADEPVTLLREADNRHDPSAVRVLNARGEQAGYLPRRLVTWLAPLLDRREVVVEGMVAGTRSHHHNPAPLDLRLTLTVDGVRILSRNPDPAGVAEALHQTVLESFLMARRWERPELIREIGERMRKGCRDDLLPETQMLLTLFPALEKAKSSVTDRHADARVRDALQKVVLGDALHCHNLTMFPLYVPDNHKPEYLLLQEAVDKALAEVTEISEGGSVPELKVLNRGEKPVLILEGEILTGAKQNRVVNISVMVSPHEELVLPVSCVEQGRWHHVQPDFKATHYAPPTLRGKKNMGVNRSRSMGRGLYSNQGEVWEDVAYCLRESEVRSSSDSLTDGLDATKQQRHEYDERLRLPDGAAGVLLAMGDTIIGMDLFDTPRTMHKAWERMSSAYFFEAMYKPGENKVTDRKSAEDFLGAIPGVLKTADKTLGAGVEFIVDSQNLAGNALWFEEYLCHLGALRVT